MVTINILFQYQSFLLPTDAQKNCFERNIKIYTKSSSMFWYDQRHHHQGAYCDSLRKLQC